jgi:hypothetical protein
MDRETISEFFDGRTWGLSALILIGVVAVWFVVSVQMLGASGVSLDYARRAELPRWVSVYVGIIEFSLFVALPMGIAGLFVDKRRGYAGLAVAAFVLSLAMFGCAFE